MRAKEREERRKAKELAEIERKEKQRKAKEAEAAATVESEDVRTILTGWMMAAVLCRRCACRRRDRGCRRA